MVGVSRCGRFLLDIISPGLKIHRNVPLPMDGLPGAVRMTPAEALCFLGHEARQCHDRDAHEALCLLMPALLNLLELAPMDDYQALDFRIELRKALTGRQAASPAPRT
jgi:hypothetical protein